MKSRRGIKQALGYRSDTYREKKGKRSVGEGAKGHEEE